MKIPVSNAKYRSSRARKARLGIALCSCALLFGCGQKRSAPLPKSGAPAFSSSGQPAMPPLQQQTEQKLDPLTPEDVELYLKVMRAAAQRVKSPAPADKAVLANASKILAGSSTGRVPTAADVKTLDRANLIALYMDQIVADDMKMDGRTYRGIAEAVENVIRPPRRVAPSKDASAAIPVGKPTPLETQLNTVNVTNEKFLALYREEIEGLIAVVRNPDNLPK